MDCQAPLSVKVSRQEHWKGFPFPTPGDLPDLGIKPVSLVSSVSVGRFFTATPPGKVPPHQKKKKNMNRRSELILKDSQTHNIPSTEVVEADMIMKIAVNWDVCYDRDGGINFWAEEQGERNQGRHQGRTDRCRGRRRNSPGEVGLRQNSIWVEERVHATSMETKTPLMMKQ